MRIVFMGATELGWECCRTLLDIGQEVVGIFSIPREFRISWSATSVNNVQFKSFEGLAEQHSIPLVYVEKKMSDPEYREWLQRLKPDILIVIGWYYMLPRSLRELAPLGAIGIHASLLPKYRGGAPLVWAIINGETKTGVSLFYMEDGVDTGDIIAQKEIEITPGDDIKSVYEKATLMSLEIVRDYVPLLREGTAPRHPQDHSAATQFPQRKPEDGLIDWSKSSEEIKNFIRAQTKPYPGAFTYINGKRVTIWDADISNSPDAV